MGNINSIKINKFEQLLNEGYGVKAISCFFGVSTNTLNTWVKQNYDNKTAKQIYLERRNDNGSPKN